MENSNTSRIPLLIIFGIFIFSGYLIFKNLGDSSLWGDEAVTAIIAKNFEQTGHFTAWDGRNMQSGGNGAYLRSNFDVRDPPAMFILTALSFRIFGATTFSARLPFAILGLLTVILLYLLIRLELPDRPWAAVYSSGFLGLFPEYILYVRCCRYYSLVIFSIVLTFIAYRLFLRRPSLKNSLFLATSAALLFFSHYLIAAAFLVPLALLHLFQERKRLLAGGWIALALLIALFSLLTVPYAISGRVWEHPFLPEASGYNQVRILLIFLRDAFTTGLAPWMIILAALIVSLTSADRRLSNLIKFSLYLILLNIVILGLTSQQHFSSNALAVKDANIRYAIGCFPFTAILVGGMLQWMHERSRIRAVLLGIIITSTNLSYSHPWPEPNRHILHPMLYSPLYSYWKEIHSHYQTSTEAIASFLFRTSRQNETFIAYPDYRNDPLAFYLGSKMIKCAGFDSNNCLGASKLKSISPYLLKNENYPDWLVFFGLFNNAFDEALYFSRTVRGKNGVPINHEYEIALDMPVFAPETNRPEIYWHNFGDLKNFGHSYHVILLQQVPGDSASWQSNLPGIIQCARLMENDEIILRNMGTLMEKGRYDDLIHQKLYPRAVFIGMLDAYKRALLKSNQPKEAGRIDILLGTLKKPLKSADKTSPEG